MIHLDAALSQPDPALLDTPGAFLWWYADATDGAGNGVVLIWSWGLPFLPGTRSAPGSPRHRPSLNVCVYRQGRPVAYVLEELPEAQATWSGDSWTFGSSRLSRERHGDRLRLIADLDCEIPGSPHRLTGSVTLDGPLRTGPEGSGPTHDDHEWAPVLGPARAEVRLAWGGGGLDFQGLGYHDRNAARAPLDALGFERWTWGRVSGPEVTAIWYVLWPEVSGKPQVVGLEIDDRGAARVLEGLEVDLRGPRRGWLGMPRWHEVRLVQGDAPWLTARLSRPVDDGPFYVRQLAEATWRGEPLHGVSEVCVPQRIDRPWHRPLVQMSVHRPGGGSSLWAPLFVGPRQDRWSRLVRSWSPR